MRVFSTAMRSRCPGAAPRSRHGCVTRRSRSPNPVALQTQRRRPGGPRLQCEVGRADEHRVQALDGGDRRHLLDRLDCLDHHDADRIGRQRRPGQAGGPVARDPAAGGGRQRRPAPPPRRCRPAGHEHAGRAPVEHPARSRPARWPAPARSPAFPVAASACSIGSSASSPMRPCCWSRHTKPNPTVPMISAVAEPGSCSQPTTSAARSGRSTPGTLPGARSQPTFCVRPRGARPPRSCTPACAQSAVGRHDRLPRDVVEHPQQGRKRDLGTDRSIRNARQIVLRRAFRSTSEGSCAPGAADDLPQHIYPGACAIVPAPEPAARRAR